ncbi:hypothetical protein EPN18_05060 [bacterium]|nr:MAG: hypothetical protein EPN18_05060 [bacterium]
MLKTAIADIIKLAFLYSARYTLPLLPIRLVWTLAECAGFVSYTLNDKKGKAIKSELKKMLGERFTDKELKTVLRRSFVNSIKSHFETWTFPKLNREKTAKMSYFSGMEHLDESLKKGKGAIILLSHFGAYKFVLPALGYMGYKINQMAVKPTIWKDGTMIRDKFMDIESENEKKIPAKFIYIEESLKPVFKALMNNEIVVMSIDSLLGSGRVPYGFFNNTILFNNTPMMLSLRIGSPLIPTFIVRQKDDKHKIIFEKPLVAGHEIKEDVAVKNLTGDFAALFEKYFMESPWQYATYLPELRKNKLLVN